MRIGNYEADLVAVEARRASLGPSTPPVPVPVPATASTAAGVTRAAPSLDGYDDLLTTEGVPA